MTKSLYAILNVAPDADPAVVEAAYKALMKKYHPDVRTEDPETAQRMAAEINEAFHILKDPAKRSDYDTAERVRRETIRRNSVIMAEAPRPYQQPPAPRRRRSKWISLLMIVAAATAVFYIWRGSDAARGDQAFRPLTLTQVRDRLSELRPGGEDAELVPVSETDVHRAVAEFSRIKERSGLLGLSAYSTDCFAGQSRSGRASDFDFCVAFDKAALTYGLDLPGADYLPQLPRFEAKEIARRHAAAGKLLSNDEGLIEARIAQVGILTSQRLRSLNPVSVVSEPPVTVASAARAHRPIPTARRQHVRRPRSRNPRPKADPDFLEREGYIY